MAAQMEVVSPPAGGIYRLARRTADPFALPDWERAEEDGTFGNRFDDPSGLIGRSQEERFRTLYCATQRLATFGETLARLRPANHLQRLLEDIQDDEPIESTFAGTRDPDYLDRGLISADWRDRRQVGHTVLAPADRFIDVSAASTLNYLNEHLQDVKQSLGIPEVDLSTITSKHRLLTQLAASHIYHLGYSGVRYVSRLDARWECWALFEGRYHHQMGYPISGFSIGPDDEDLCRIAQIFGLSIEVISGNPYLLRPWQE